MCAIINLKKSPSTQNYFSIESERITQQKFDKLMQGKILISQTVAQYYIKIY